MAQDGAITTGLDRIFLLAPKEMFSRLSPVSPVNVLTLNSPAGHSAWYVGRTHACVRACAFICGSKGDVAMTPPGVRGNVGHCDDDAYFSSTGRNCPGNVKLKSYDVLCFTYMSSSASCTQV